MVKLLAFCGSTREDSFNQNLLEIVVEAARHAGAEVMQISLTDFPMVIYNGDEEAASGIPESARRLKALMHDHDAYIIGCPEYNGYMTPLLVNTLDWCSRADDGGADLSVYDDKPVMISSASPGGFGGARSATHLRTMLGGIGCIVLPYAVTLARAGDAFNDDGKLKDEQMHARIERNAARFVQFVEKHDSGERQ